MEYTETTTETFFKGMPTFPLLYRDQVSASLAAKSQKEIIQETRQ
jgi:hypothetical protein